jgi:hypothetical protein
MYRQGDLCRRPKFAKVLQGAGKKNQIAKVVRAQDQYTFVGRLGHFVLVYTTHCADIVAYRGTNITFGRNIFRGIRLKLDRLSGAST